MQYSKKRLQNRKRQQTIKNKKSLKQKSFQEKQEKNTLSNLKKTRIVQNFMEMLNTIKLYHWNTYSFAEHKATDELYSKLNENIDAFVEIMLGKSTTRITNMDKKIELIDVNSFTTLRSKVFEFRRFLMDLSSILNEKKDTDLLNVRDEILGNINQFLYLISLQSSTYQS